jgi:hypothetical protein|tara:strand:- start:3591 stop:3791 length:201 start_codon:yes stop_codon:yes gene_type:complete
MSWNEFTITAEEYDKLNFPQRVMLLRKKGYPAFDEKYLREMGFTKKDGKAAWYFRWVEKDNVSIAN